jgi:hypothetical protein
MIQYLTSPAMGLNAQQANQVLAKFMTTAAATVSRRNLEDLDDFARDYIVKE